MLGARTVVVYVKLIESSAYVAVLVVIRSALGQQIKESAENPTLITRLAECSATAYSEKLIALRGPPEPV